MIKKILIPLLFLIVLSACKGDSPLTDDLLIDPAAINATVASLATADYKLTQTMLPTQTQTPFTTATVIQTIDRTRPPIYSPTAEIACDQAAAGIPIDVTIPDGTVLTPGESFSKTWRLKNVGSCTWTRQYALTFFSGNSLKAFQTITLSQEVAPGQVIDLTVDMEAPQSIGTYQSNWMLSNPAGELFGIGPHGDAPFWVQIKVVSIMTGTPQTTPTVTKTPVVFLTGDVQIGNGDQFDFDSGQLNPMDATSTDLLYQVGGSPAHILMTMNGTQWKMLGKTRPSFGDCVDADLSGYAISFEDVPAGNYVCYRTSGSLPGRFLIDRFEAGKLFVTFLTWAVP